MVLVPTEKSIEQKFLRECNKRGWLATKQNIIGRRGFPDRLIIVPGGLHIWCEFKRPGGVLSENQKSSIAKLKQLGCYVSVCFSYEEAIKFIEDCIYGQDKISK